MKSNILFGVVGWNIAETTRMIEIAKSLRLEYECHFFSYGGQYLSLIEAEGFQLHRLMPVEDDEKIDLLWRIDRGEAFQQPWTKEELRLRLQHEIELIEDLNPTFCFLGSVLTFSISCKITNRLLFNFIPLNLSKAYIEAGLPISPFQPNWVNKLARWVFLNIPILMSNVSTVMKERGLIPAKNLLELWTGDVNIVAEPRELSLLKELPSSWYYSGPLFAHLKTEIPSDVLNILQSKQRKIYFAMGSSANKTVLHRVLAAFEGVDAMVIAPIRTHIDASTIIPNNVIVTDWLPALEVTSLVDVAVIHGGQGTVQTTVMAGVPFIGIGMQPEQELNIFIYKEFGNAIQLPKHVKTRKVRDAIQELIANPTFASKAIEAQKILKQADTLAIIHEIIAKYVK